MSDPVAEMLLQAEQDEQDEAAARKDQMERIETLLSALIEEFRAFNKAEKGETKRLKSGKQRFSITVTGRDDSERIETVEIS